MLVEPEQKDFQMTLEKLFLWTQNEVEYYDLQELFVK